jgi:hypothetical protein
MRPTYNHDNALPAPAARCPSGVRAAARIWTIMGVLQLLTLAFVLVVTLGGPASAQKAAPHVTQVLLGVLFGVVLLMAGRQTKRGTATDTMGNGVGSLLIGLLNLAYAYMLSKALADASSLPEPVVLASMVGAAVGGLGGLALVVAGALAISGRDDYRAWRQGRERSQAGAQR